MRGRLRSRRSWFWHRVVLLAMLVGLVVLPPVPTVGTELVRKLEQAGRVRMGELREEIDDLVSDRSCTSTQECRVVSVRRGWSGCRDYYVYSDRSVDEAPLRSKIASLDRLHRILTPRNWPIPCLSGRRPDPVCIGGQCSEWSLRYAVPGLRLGSECGPREVCILAQVTRGGAVWYVTADGRVVERSDLALGRQPVACTSTMDDRVAVVRGACFFGGQDETGYGYRVAAGAS